MSTLCASPLAGENDYSGFVDIVDLGTVGTNWQISVPLTNQLILAEITRAKRRWRH